eukprot:462548-Pyramimonas_sp.AAC.1
MRDEDARALDAHIEASRERGAANESGRGWTREARMQGYPWDCGLCLLCGLTVNCSAVTLGRACPPKVAFGRKK